MDNRVFNVNGDKPDQLLSTLKLAFAQAKFTKAKAWQFVPDKGLVLLWADDPAAKSFMASLTAELIAPMVEEWLKSDQAKSMLKNLQGWDGDCDHDGENHLGWRVYCEDWGHVKGNPYAICAITPAYTWYGK